MNKYLPWNWCRARLTPQTIMFNESLQRLLDSNSPVPFSNKVHGHYVWYIDFKNGIFMNAAKRHIASLKLDMKESSSSILILRHKTCNADGIDYKIIIPNISTISTHQLELCGLVGTLWSGRPGELSYDSYLYH